MTPPRSISPISTTGTSAASAKPILAMSPARRLISAGLPAPFDQHEIGVGARAAKLSSTAGSSSALQRADTRAPPALPQHAALHDDLRAALGLRLQQHRVHVTLGGDAAGARLQRLRAADLAAVGGHRRVVRHVLRLERPHRQPAPGEGARTARRRAATCRHRSRCPGASARAVGIGIRTRCPAAPSRRRGTGA